MKILDRYILKETIGPFTAGLFIFTFVLLISKLLKLAALIINKGINFSIIALLFLYIIPSLLVISLPMAILLASLFGYGRLAEDSEIIAMQSTGISYYHLIKPMIIFGSFICLVTFFVYTSVLPACNLAFKTLAVNIVKLKASAGIKEGIFNDSFDNLIIYVRQVSSDGNSLKNVLISDNRNEKNPYLIVAKEGLLLTDNKSNKVILQLQEGSLHRYNPQRDSSYLVLNFKKYTISLDVQSALQNLENAHKGEREMGLKELRMAIRDNKASNSDYHKYQIEFHKKFTIPFASIVFAIFGPLLAMDSKKGGKMGAFAISIGIIFFYYLLLSVGESFGDKGYLPPLLAMWFPNILFGGLGLVLFKKLVGKNKVNR
ncbi:MAG: LPS export ABC transporter permease LptF [bacterium]